jgi:hypothetical protein
LTWTRSGRILQRRAQLVADHLGDVRGARPIVVRQRPLEEEDGGARRGVAFTGIAPTALLRSYSRCCARVKRWRKLGMRAPDQSGSAARRYRCCPLPAAGSHGVAQRVARAAGWEAALSPRFPRLRNGDPLLGASSHPVADDEKEPGDQRRAPPEPTAPCHSGGERVGRRVGAVRRRFASAGEYGES